MGRYETFPTTADIGIRFSGRDFAELYGNALRGLNLLLFGRGSPPGGRGNESLPFRFRGDGPENVLVNFLSEALFQVNGREKRVAAVIRCAGPRDLEAELLLFPRRKAPRLEVKAPTYHNLRVSEENGVLSAAVVFDV